jgi:DNA-binding NtrC family response regulator
MAPRILVVDDDRAVRTVVRVTLSRVGMDVTTVTCPAEAIGALKNAPFDLVITDAKMPGGTGHELLEEVRTAWPTTPVVMMTGFGSVEEAVAAMKCGAADYLIKPVSRDELILVIQRALENRELKEQVSNLRRQVNDRFGFQNIIGNSAKMHQLFSEVAAISETSANVLLQGATGTGKELIAHAIHYRSQRADGPFIRVNCTAIPEALLESELFGHERGSFTGAIRQHKGRFSLANGGTILLDEIGEIDATMQTKLLRVLESGEFTPIGASQSVSVDVRVIAATNRDLQEEMRLGRFREDLYYRLNVLLVELPTLAQRADDIPTLANHFLSTLATEYDRPARTIAPSVMDQLTAYSWPGNVRQLRHVIERAVVLTATAEITTIKLPKNTTDSAPLSEPLWRNEDETLTDAVNRFERAIIIEALQEANGIQAAAARILGISRSNLNYKISRLEIVAEKPNYS